MKPCRMTWHYGTIGPVNHADPHGPQGWNGIHGEPTPNPNHVCDNCARDHRQNHPGVPVPDLSAETD